MHNNSNFYNAINNNTKNIFYIKYIYLISKSKLYFSNNTYIYKHCIN